MVFKLGIGVTAGAPDISNGVKFPFSFWPLLPPRLLEV